MSASMAAFRRPLRTILYLLSLLCALRLTCLPEALAGVRDCAANPLITVEMYEEIRDGMSPREVQHILGTSGMQELRRSSSGGYSTVSYAWQNRDGSNIQITSLRF